MYRFKIKKLKINTVEGQKEITPKTINVIIGPNNSEKSRFLKEIRDFLGGEEKKLKVIDEIEYEYPESFSILNESYDIQNKMSGDYYGNWRLRTYAGQMANNWDINASMEHYSTRNLNTISAEWKEDFENIIKDGKKKYSKEEYLLQYFALRYD